MKNSHVYVTSRDQMPTEEHWAIIEYSSIYIPGDERSRTNPGHGYGAHSQPSLTYIAFESREALQEYLDSHTSLNLKTISIQHVKPLKAKTNISISIE